MRPKNRQSMTSIAISNIVGTGVYAVPANDATLHTAQAGLSALLSAPSLPPPGGTLAFEVLYAQVRTQDGAGAPRVMDATIEGAKYNGSEVLDAATTQTMLSAIEAALVADANITSVAGLTTDLDTYNNLYVWRRSNFVVQGVDLFIPPFTFIVTQPKNIAKAVNQVIWNGSMPTWPNWQAVDISAHITPSSTTRRCYLRVTSLAAGALVAVRGGLDAKNYILASPYTTDKGVQMTSILASGQTAFLVCPCSGSSIDVAGQSSAKIDLVSVF